MPAQTRHLHSQLNPGSLGLTTNSHANLALSDQTSKHQERTVESLTEHQTGTASDQTSKLRLDMPGQTRHPSADWTASGRIFKFSTETHSLRPDVQGQAAFQHRSKGFRQDIQDQTGQSQPQARHSNSDRTCQPRLSNLTRNCRPGQAASDQIFRRRPNIFRPDIQAQTASDLKDPDQKASNGTSKSRQDVPASSRTSSQQASKLRRDSLEPPTPDGPEPLPWTK